MERRLLPRGLGASFVTDRPEGEFLTREGEPYYRISAVHRMPSFLMSIASDTDLWMFITSQGGLTAGRMNADGSLFPYETEDKLQDGHHHTGPVTLIRIRGDGGEESVWQPFDSRWTPRDPIERNLYKNAVGNRVIFEEIHHGHGLSFQYQWAGCEKYGLVRTARLRNEGSTRVSVTLLDGLRNVLPHGAPLALYQQSSSLVNAYKRADRDPDTTLVTFSLTSRIVDRAEASEELRANTVWSCGLESPVISLSGDTVDAFRREEAPVGEGRVTGARGNYLITASLTLGPDEEEAWHLVADVGRSHRQVAALKKRLLKGGDIGSEIRDELDTSTRSLLANVAAADGLQFGADRETTVHHFANVLFNNMRGGVFADNDSFPIQDLRSFLRVRNPGVLEGQSEALRALPETATHRELLALGQASGDADFERLCYEYLPLTFGRRHGDPSRPWNRFEIRARNQDGSRALCYQGNWRDIFQNWEALARSFPAFLPSFLAKFVNASTVDGFNPYRISQDGFDWEEEDPEDPWSYIGYWGDHQIIYLLKFLEALPRAVPGALEAMLTRDVFSYADIPYRLKSYPEILADPHHTVLYDNERARDLEARVEQKGTDGKLIPNADGSVLHVNLVEKLLVPILSKLSNLVPDGGIWMNTQRPEWNDANNALAGNGLSMVTLYYLRRHLAFFADLLDGEAGEILISAEVAEWRQGLHEVLERHRPLLAGEVFEDTARKTVLDELGEVFSRYREAVYGNGLSRRTPVAGRELAGLARLALEYLDHAIRVSVRGDGLYEAYNLLEIASQGVEAKVHSLYPMLEGQVAALSSGVVAPAEAVSLIERLFESDLYRACENSFMLYPERELPAFVEKNVIPEERVDGNPLLRALVDEEDTSILIRDAFGLYRFHADFQNAGDVELALKEMAGHEAWADRVRGQEAAVLAVFEEVFRHRAFTGRSGTMVGYEGLGSVYWHMVAKLLVAIQEIALKAVERGEPEPVVHALFAAYYRVRGGLGFEKTPAEYGAFPSDPYSHTPASGGARQPGMTGQVKEEILTRQGELGIAFEEGRLAFRPRLLRALEFRDEAGTFPFVSLSGEIQSLEVPAEGLLISVCQVPVIYRLDDEAWTRVTLEDGDTAAGQGSRLPRDISASVLAREGKVALIEVGVPREVLFRP